ncbi:MAG: zf-TFIIB domain-containing protein [Planctomycetota bacterium]
MPTPRKKPTKPTSAAASRPRAATNADLVPEGQRPCPICGARMQSVRRAGEVIDVCGDHGVWLDRWELERVVAGHGVRARRRSDAAEAKARREVLWWPFGSLFDGRDG